MLYMQYTHVIHVYITMIYIHIALSLHKFYTIIIIGVCASVNQSKTWLYTLYTSVKLAFFPVT